MDSYTSEAVEYRCRRKLEVIPDKLKEAQAFLERNLPTMDLDSVPTYNLKTLYQLAWKRGVNFPPALTELFWHC